MDKPFISQFDIPGIYEFHAQQRNYEIYDFEEEDDDRCFIYFTSNAVYSPNTREAFDKRLVQGDRYDWKKNIVRPSKKAIFLRDVLKTWYIEGINSEINSIEKIADFLSEETRGLKLTFIGSSAGGYAATLFGCLLQGERIFNFSGQMSLHKHIEPENIRAEHPLLVKYENRAEVNRFYSLKPYIQNCSTPIFYFYPALCDLDIPQAEEVAGLGSVYRFAFNTQSHSKTCYNINFLDLFNKDNKELIDLHDKYRNKLINSFDFSLKVSGYRKTLSYALEKIRKEAKSA